VTPGPYLYPDGANFGGALYFGGSDAAGAALWRTDGTAAGTTVVRRFSGPAAGLLGPSLLTVVNGSLYFAADDGVHDIELWRSDGTVLVRDVFPGSAALAGLPPLPNNAYPVALTDVGGVLYFVAEDGVHGRELWRSDGTAAGTVLAADANPGSATGVTLYGPQRLAVAGGAAFVVGDDASRPGRASRSTPAPRPTPTATHSATAGTSTATARSTTPSAPGRRCPRRSSTPWA
jgi:ELWxxDGT repeat protein